MANKVVPCRTENVSHNSENSIIKKNSGMWIDFANQSTCAAVVHLGEKSQPITIKIIWSVTLVVGTVLTAITTYYSASSFMNSSGSSELKLQSSPTFGIEHPKYHICTPSIFNLTILAEMGFVDAEMISYLLLVTSPVAVSPVLLFNIQHQRQLETKFNQILADNRINDVVEIIQRALFKCSDIIAGCIVPEMIDGVVCCAKYFPSGSFISTTGACVSSVDGLPFYQAIPSMAFGFVVLVHDLEDNRQILDNSIINPIMANQRGVSFAVNDKLTHPTVALFQTTHFTRIGLWASLALSRTTAIDEISQLNIIGKSCAPEYNPDLYRYLVPGFKNYTQSNCRYALLQKQANALGHCYIVSLPYQGNLSSCRPFQIVQLTREILGSQINFENVGATNTSSECVEECRKETYSISASHANIQIATNFKFGNWTISQNQSNQLAVLCFYYPSLTQTLLITHYATFVDWIGNLGGNVGLFLGASAVSVIELLVLCYNCCCWPIRKN